VQDGGHRGGGFGKLLTLGEAEGDRLEPVVVVQGAARDALGGRLSFLQHASFCQRRAVVNGRSVFQQQFPAVEGTGGGRRLSARVTAFALTVVRTPWLLAGLLPVTHDGRKAGQVFADKGLRVLGEKVPGHLIPSLRMGLEGPDHQRASS
jgi:hypothetical protein